MLEILVVCVLCYWLFCKASSYRNNNKDDDK